ncbi:barstar family protein [Actinomadura macrotermitis]|uniref:Barstar (barnase inhibitor) domain-containing protein n=1 Tax=Actinomadura macrotermitis TaxID=2585200 RepID=A0A7K0BVY2_9ACTN|nr:barstar family protein [Actinomadura macrotermitis]MQY05335.1 hypothetical protein [Actinomadura macrotermitis]
MEADLALGELLAGRLRPGLYQWRAADPGGAPAQAAEAGLRAFVLDGRRILDKDTLLRACAEVFDFPEWFGANWDALEDCLTDLSWAPAHRGYLVLYEGWTRLAGDDEGSFRTALDVFAEAVESWRDTPTPMSVLLPVRGVEDAGLDLLNHADPC